MKSLPILMAFFQFIATACAALPTMADPQQEYRDRQDNATPESVLKWLKDGNERFAGGKAIHGGYAEDARERIEASSSSQRPLAVILSCIDSRTSPEVVFDTTVGDLFTVRVGGNVINDDVLGSLEVSVASGAKVIVVLGHKDCGAIKGACRNVEFGHLTQLLEKVKPSIKITNETLDNDLELSHHIGERVVTNPKYIAEISHTNARQSKKEIFARSQYIRGQIEKGEVQLLSALYDVNSGVVTFSEEEKEEEK